MNYLDTYRQNVITTQAPGQVVVLLYEGAIRFLRQARRAADGRDYEKRNHFIGRAQDVIFELNASLNMDAGGEIAGNLRSLYTFLWVQLTGVNLRNDVNLLERLTAILESLSGAWKAAAQK